MSMLAEIQKNWKALGVIGVIIGGTIFGWNYAMAQAKDAARTEVQATVNKEMIDGAKKAAADAVKEQLPAIAAEVAKQVAAEVVKAQKEEAKNK
jgi:predicted negative regulator of RcsB-dependent stress response